MGAWKPFSGSFEISAKQVISSAFEHYREGIPAVLPPPNPNPYRFRIVHAEEFGRFSILKVNYPDCTTFEGNKILLFEGVSVAELKKQGMLDPHFFCSTEVHTPIARFIPTKAGMEMARALSRTLSRKRK